VVQVIVDPNEPPAPRDITSEQAFKFADSLARGQKDSWKIMKTVLKEKVREVIET
jgi:pyruvate dehydrogenase (quinone)/pyruvate oxidase